MGTTYYQRWHSQQERSLLMSIHDIESQALRLPRHERARLAQHLIASLEEEDETEQAWIEEAGRRDDELRTGHESAVPVGIVLKDARALLK